MSTNDARAVDIHNLELGLETETATGGDNVLTIRIPQIELMEHRRFSPISTSEELRHESEAKLISWDGPEDSQDPYNWPLWKKYWTIGVALCMTFVCSMNGTVLSVAHNPINAEFNVSDANFPNSYWPTVSWGVGGALFPLILFPAMEDFGVRPVVLSTYFVFICSLIPVGFAQKFTTLIVVRFFSGGCVQILSNAVGGIISNVLADDRARSIPISLYVTVYLSMTSFGPVLGSAILQHQSWRWIGHIELIWTVAFLPFFFFAMPESCGPAILASRARRLRKEGIKISTAAELERVPKSQVILKSVQRPLYMLLTEPVAFVAIIWVAFSLGSIYLFTQSVEQVYGENYGWNSIQAGYVQAAISVGELLGCGLCVLSNRWYYSSASRNKEIPGTPIPEARLYASIIGGLVGVTGGMFVYGWTSSPDIHWMAPTIGLVMVGFGTNAVVVSIANYLIDAYAKYAASVLAACGLVENMSIAFLPLATSSMYTNLGFQWASSLLALISLALVATPLAVLQWGKEIRSRSPFMSEAIIDRQRNDDTEGNV